MTQHHPKPGASRIALLLTLLFLAIPLNSRPALASTKKPAPKPSATRSRAATAKPRPATTHSRTISAAPARTSRRRHTLHPAAPPTPHYTPAAIEETLAEPQSTPFFYPHNLDPFFRALAAQQAAPDSADTPASTIRILQFGDSHTAADLFTGDLRAQLQSHFGNGGLGFQYPGHPFAGYHLAGSTRTQTSGWSTEGNKFTQLGDGDLGLGGISLSTTRPGESIQLIAPCTTFQVHYLIQPGGGALRFTDNGTYISDIDTSGGSRPSTHADPQNPSSNNEPEEAASSTQTVTSQTQSSSGEPGEPGSVPTISPGTLTYACTSGDHDLRLTTLDRAPVRLLGLVTESPGITYECLGINGAVAPLMLRWNQALFADYLRQRNPNLIVLAYGTNEAAIHPEDYASQFRRIIANLHRIVPEAAVLVLGPYDRATRVGRGRRASWQTFSGTERVIEEQKEACREEHCAFYDERRRMGGPGSMIRWASAALAQPDHTHLTGTGYRDLAEALYRDLLAAYQAYQHTPDAARKPPLHTLYNPATILRCVPSHDRTMRQRRPKEVPRHG